MRHCLFAFVLVVCACTDRNNDPDPQGVDAANPACSNIAGTWGITGGCGADTCVITQAGCTTQLDCGGGASSYTGSITGNTFMYSGTAGGGTPASCSGTLNGSLMSGSCNVAGVPCSFSGQRL